MVKSTTGKSITAAHNERAWRDVIESCHVKLPRVGLNGEVFLRWFSVVAHVMPVFLYKYLFAPGHSSEFPETLDRERANPPTRSHCETDWCEVIRGYTMLQLSECLGRFQKLWTDNDMASLLPDELEDGDTIPDSSVSERFRSCLARYSWDRMGCRLFPLSLNALEEAVDPLNTHKDPDNAMVYPTLLTTTALLNLTLYSSRDQGDTTFSGGPFERPVKDIRKDLRAQNRSEVEFPPDNGGIEMRFGRGTRYPFLTERDIESLSLLSLFRELRDRASVLNKKLEHQVRIMWFRLCEIAYKRRRQAHIDSRTTDSGLTLEQELALFDAVSGASVEFRS